MATELAKLAVSSFRDARRERFPGMRSTRRFAREYAVTVPQMHDAAHCINGEGCDGKGCRL